MGERLIAESRDSKSKKFLLEKISLAIQRGNAASSRGTFPDSVVRYLTATVGLKRRKTLFPNHSHSMKVRLCIYIYRAIKLICNRVIHESEIVCRFLNKKHSLKHRLDLGSGYINRKDKRIQIHG
jgi:hypothetical protein